MKESVTSATAARFGGEGVVDGHHPDDPEVDRVRRIQVVVDLRDTPDLGAEILHRAPAEGNLVVGERGPTGRDLAEGDVADERLCRHDDGQAVVVDAVEATDADRPDPVDRAQRCPRLLLLLGAGDVADDDVPLRAVARRDRSTRPS